MDTALSRPPIGQVLDGRYRVESLIAHGGMATVCLGTDTRLDRTVALKIMHAEYANDEDFVRRFVGEARSVARLSHPNVVTVFDQGADGRILYLAMEYVRGRTLRDLLRERGHLRPREALAVMEGMLSGLAAAHQAGLAHRDVKPENVLITDAHTVKVADFGLAMLVSGTRHTHSGMLMGTAAYLAPEQVSGGAADARTDVYAAGVVLFELLTGRQPHTGDTPLMVAYKHVNEAVPPPSGVAAEVPQALDALVAMATSRDPDLRPADAGQFLRAVSGVRHSLPPDNHPRQARPDAWPAQPPPYTRQDLIPGMAPPAPQQYETPPGGVPGSALTEQFQDLYRQEAHQTLIVSAGDDGSYGMPPGGYAEPREPRLQRLLFSRRLGYLAAGLVAVVLLGGLVWWQTAGRFTSVPRVNGMTLAAARAELRSLGLSVTTGTPRLDNSVARGKVIGSLPAAGARVAKGGRVTLVVSGGPHILTVPQVSGQTLTAAEAALHKAGLAPGHVKRETSATVPAGIVISTQPAAGASWPQPRPVALLVSAGPPVPYFIGQQKAIAQAWATQSGAVLNSVTSTKSSQTAGTIISQSPAAGAPYTRGEVITITIAAGPPLVNIPDVTGMKVQQAVHALQQDGFKVTLSGSGPFQQVFSYSPTGQAPQGSTITLYIGIGIGG